MPKFAPSRKIAVGLKSVCTPPLGGDRRCRVGDRFQDGKDAVMSKRQKRGVPEGLWQRCPGCHASIYRKEAEKRLNICPECDYHFYVSAKDRITQVLDEGTFEEWYADLTPVDPL